MRYKKGLKGRFGRVLAVASVTVAATLSWSPGPASADDYDRLYPAGCNKYAKNPWTNNCSVGHQFIDLGTSVLGVQFVLAAKGFNPGTPDCDFGPRTDAATVRFQAARGLQQDGEVGPRTWTALQGEISFSGLADTYGYYYNVGGDGLRFYYDGNLGQNWFVLDPYYELSEEPIYVVMSDADTHFCP